MENILFGVSIGTLVFLIPLLPLIGAALNGLIAIFCRSGRAAVPTPLVNLIGVGTPILSFAVALYLYFLVKDPAAGLATPPVWTWIAVGDFAANLSFKADRLSLVMSLVVTGVGSLIHIYSTGYMAHDKGYARYFAYLNLFLFAMLILVLAGNLPLLFVGWEGVGLCSYLLIGFWFEDPEKAYAGKKAFVVNRIGDLGFLLGMFLIYSHLSAKGVTTPEGLLSFEVMEKYKGDLFLVATPVCLLLFVGAIGKSAQIPLYVWLPDAMAGPTPVSALIHAATMVTAGVYMIARLHFLYTLSPVAMQVVAVVGISTAFFAATIAVAQNDIKKVLAYSTISQLGYMFFAVGVGAFAAAIFHLVTHAFFKACLFLGAGSVIHGMGGEQDIWKMGGLRKKMPATFLTFAAAVLAISGIFPFAGFFSKDAILWQGFAMGHPILWGVGFATAGLTAFYMSRLLALVFLARPKGGEGYLHAHESPLTMTIPLVLLALLSLAGGWIGIPESIKGHDHFFRWLAPLFPYEEFFRKLEAKGHGLELLLSIVTLLWVFHIGLFALLLYGQKPMVIERFGGKIAPLHRLIANKFYVDEIYQLLFVRPVGWFSEKILWRFHDEKVVDALMVEGSAETVGLVGRAMAALQTGIVQSYALFFAVGAIVLIGFFVL
jgi:NADH-quinone oxidoreductase subunit L